MRPLVLRSPRPLALALVAGLALAGCGRLNRTATINQVTEIPGATEAATLQHELASHGLSGVHVTCEKTLIVNVGANVACRVTGAGQSRTVRLRYVSSDGAVVARVSAP